MLSQKENDSLTRVGPGTLMGEVMRRYWLPALLAEEIPAPDCAPVRVRLLGEDLIGFRDSRGKVGLLAEHCAHRGTSLFFGRNEDCGLRCIYHGWKYDVDGNILETPAEPAGSEFGQKLRHIRYPCQEVAGMIFTYMGPTEKQPVSPQYEWASLAPETICPVKSYLDCNYLQGIEGDFDSSHTSFLTQQYPRSGGPQARRRADLGSRNYRVRHEGGSIRQAAEPTDLCPHQSLYHAVVQHRARSAYREIRRGCTSVKFSLLGAHRRYDLMALHPEHAQEAICGGRTADLAQLGGLRLPKNSQRRQQLSTGP